MNARFPVVFLGVFVSCAGFLRADPVGFRFDERTGAVASGIVSFSNRYTLLTHSGDAEAVETEDVVVGRSAANGWTEFRCTNTKLPEVEIVKRYVLANGGLRRTLRFVNRGRETKYLTPFTEGHFNPDFRKGLWHLGAGYIGPYKPFPEVKAPRPVNEYKQSSKGLVFIHPRGTAQSNNRTIEQSNNSPGNFSHYRVKIDEQVVLPWWHSTIGHYREYHDRLWYLPDGYRMGLGTFGLFPGKPISVTDQFNAFDGDLFTFFDGIFAKDPDIAAELKSISPPPAAMRDLYAYLPGDSDDMVRWMAEMTDEGVLVPRGNDVYSWCDYSPDHVWNGYRGGFIRPEEMRAFLDRQRAISPRVKPSIYGIVISASFFTEVFKEHSEWFRVHDRDGNADSLFPGQNLNWQTMFNNADCRAWIVDMLVRMARFLKTDQVYLDETQMTNTIDWDRDQITLDSDTVRFWKELRTRFAAEGLSFSANGSGVPYADHNYMESPHELAPERWRDWVGVGWAIGMMHRLRPGQRATPLYWAGTCDCANRLLALGWVPSTYLKPRGLPVMRAVWQGGAMVPVNAKYSPDWKTDFAIEVESHAVKREDAKDVLLSFINRAKAAADVPVEVRLETLGFDRNERISIWRQHLDEDLAGRSNSEMLSDREIKANWRKGVLVQARITDPELVYSGPADGVFRDVLRGLAPNRMEQYLVTASPVSFFADDDLPLAGFYTAQRQGRIRGRDLKLARAADLLFADRDHGFKEITANGAPVRTRRIRLNGGLVGTLVHLEKGIWKLGWKTARAESSADAAELPVAARSMKSAVRPARGHYEPEECRVRDVAVVRDGVRITKAATCRNQTETSYSLQPELPLTVTSADPEKLRLAAGNSRREFRTRETETFAGFELQGARRLTCTVSNNFAAAKSLFLGHVIKYSRNAAGEQSFAGMVVDYRAGGKYVKRVSMAMGLYSPKYLGTAPKWGTGRKPDEVLELGEWVDEEPVRTFTVDLARHAPKDWDGTAFVSIGTSHIQANRALMLDILAFNDDRATDLVEPKADQEARKMPPPLKSKPLKTKPKSLRKIDAAEWKDWAQAGNFLKIGEGRLKAGTRVHVAHDYEYLYIGFEADEPKRRPLASNADAAANEHVEVMVVRPDGTLYQAIGDAKGGRALYLQRRRADAARIIVRGETVPGVGWRTFLAIPIDDLKFDMQRTPVTVKADFCRVRKTPQESSAWTPLAKDFFEQGRYGTLILDFNWSK